MILNNLGYRQVKVENQSEKSSNQNFNKMDNSSLIVNNFIYPNSFIVNNENIPQQSPYNHQYQSMQNYTLSYEAGANTGAVLTNMDVNYDQKSMSLYNQQAIGADNGCYFSPMHVAANHIPGIFNNGFADPRIHNLPNVAAMHPRNWNPCTGTYNYSYDSPPHDNDVPPMSPLYSEHNSVLSDLTLPEQIFQNEPLNLDLSQQQYDQQQMPLQEVDVDEFDELKSITTIEEETILQTNLYVPVDSTQHTPPLEEFDPEPASQPEPSPQPQPQAEEPTTLTMKIVRRQQEELKKNGDFQCQFCGKDFFRKCYLIQHINAQHKEERNFRCPKCGKKFECHESMKIHENRHSGKKRFSCDKCTKEFIHKSDLSRHKLKHALYQPHQCNLCEKGFARRDHLAKHLESHRKKEARKIAKLLGQKQW